MQQSGKFKKYWDFNYSWEVTKSYKILEEHIWREFSEETRFYKDEL